MVVRDDVPSRGNPPANYQRAIREIGGLNPFGEPNYRFVRAETVMKYEGAEWHEWREGSHRADRGGLNFEDDGSVVPSQEQPLRIVAEMRWVQKYPHLHGWILQEWHPAHKYGTPEFWYSFKVPGHGDLCRLGPYPTYGDYEMAAPCVVLEKVFRGKLPPIDGIEDAIHYIHSRREYWAKMTPERRVQLRMDDMEEQAAVLERMEETRRRDMIWEQLKPYWGSSLEAGRLRTGLADQAGLRSHVGN